MHRYDNEDRARTYKRILYGMLIFGCMCAACIIFIFVRMEYAADDEASVYSECIEENSEEKYVIPSGEPIGIYIKTDGVFVVNTEIVDDVEGGHTSPCEGKLKQGDYIVSIDGTEVNTRKQVTDLVNKCHGDCITIGYRRDGVVNKVDITPTRVSESSYKLGLWIKDDISGIGTMTYIDEDSFAALGHSVSDYDTGLEMNSVSGGVYEATILGIDKSSQDNPGKIRGSIMYSTKLIGIVNKNIYSGVTGKLNKNYVKKHYDDEEKVLLGSSEDVSLGKAYIYSRITGELEKYEINIVRIDYDGDVRNLQLKVTDDRLIELTGGIVQGMSGSPIIQDDKLIGAVTHVIVDDPTMGYGIFIENME